MTEVRSVSATGGEKGVKPQRYALLPKKGLDAIAEVFAFGAEKYADHNWRRGYEWDKSFDALFRHAFAAQDGETHDPESGLPHLAHAGFHVLVLLTWLAEQGEGADNPMDTRWPAGMERARRQAEQEAAEQEAAEQEAALEAFHLPPRYVSDVPSGTGDLTENESDVERVRAMAERGGQSLAEAAQEHGMTLPFEPSASREEAEPYARVWIQQWISAGERSADEIARDVRRAMAHFTVEADGTVTDNTTRSEIPTEDLRM